MGIFKTKWKNNKEKVLKEVEDVKRPNGGEICGEAVEQPTDQKALADIALNSNGFYRTRIDAVDKLTDISLAKKAILDIFSEHVSQENLYAAEKLTNQELLGYIIEIISQKAANGRFMDDYGPQDWDVLFCALGRLTDRKIISDIAKSNKFESVRNKAKEKLMK